MDMEREIWRWRWRWQRLWICSHPYIPYISKHSSGRCRTRRGMEGQPTDAKQAAGSLGCCIVTLHKLHRCGTR